MRGTVSAFGSGKTRVSLEMVHAFICIVVVVVKATEMICPVFTSAFCALVEMVYAFTRRISCRRDDLFSFHGVFRC